MAGSHSLGALQPDGRVAPEPTFDVQHVADAIVHVAGLPLGVTVLTFNIMYVLITLGVQSYWMILLITLA